MSRLVKRLRWTACTLFVMVYGALFLFYSSDEVLSSSSTGNTDTASVLNNTQGILISRDNESIKPLGAFHRRLNIFQKPARRRPSRHRNKQTKRPSIGAKKKSGDYHSHYSSKRGHTQTTESKSSKSSKGKRRDDTSYQCRNLDFRRTYNSNRGKGGKRNKGKNPSGNRARIPGGMGGINNNGISNVFRRSHSLQEDDDRMLLMFQGENCDPSVLEKASQNPMLSILVDLIDLAGLSYIFDCPGPFTLLAPTNAAFAMLGTESLQNLMNPANRDFLEDILLYHIVPGAQFSYTLERGPLRTLHTETVSVDLRPLRFGDGVVTQADTLACNGIIHVIDEVLLPSSVDPPQPDFCEDFEFIVATDNGRLLQLEGERCDPNVLETARQDPTLSTFVALIETAGLEDVFFCAGPFTALIPVNAAFDALDPSYLEYLLDPANIDELREVLLYHMIGGIVLTSELVPGPLTTIQGEPVTVSVDPVLFNGEGLVEGDIPACNGIIDKINGVLFPPSLPPPTIPPTGSPVAIVPTLSPSTSPSVSSRPSSAPVSGTQSPTASPSQMPSMSSQPSNAPFSDTRAPTTSPSEVPSVSSEPSTSPLAGSMAPTVSNVPSASPSSQPGGPTSNAPSALPSVSVRPSTPPSQGSMAPSFSVMPSLLPSSTPSSIMETSEPSQRPSVSDIPSSLPSLFPSTQPSMQQSQEPSESPVTLGPTTTPTIELVRIRVREYFLSYSVPGLTSEPTEEDLEALLTSTATFWDMYFRAFYEDQPEIRYRGLDLNPVEVLYNAGIPEEVFNYYIEFDTVILYELDTTEPPGARETFSIMSDANFQVFILDFIRPVDVFATCEEVLFLAREVLVPVPAPGMFED